MSENRICKLPCSQYKPDGPTDLGVGGWCREHRDPCLLVECQRRDIIEAVLAGELSKADIDAIGYSIEYPNDRLISLEKEWRVIWDGRTYSIEQEKPCPVLIDEDKAPDGLPWPTPYPERGGKHFVPGKGRGL